MLPTSTRANNQQRKKTYLLHRIRREAKTLGMTQSEYLRLTLALSGALRSSFGDSGLDPKALLTLVESPIFSMLLQSIGKTALDAVQSQGKTADNSDEQRQNLPQPQPRQQTTSPYYRQPIQEMPRMPQMPPRPPVSRMPESQQSQGVPQQPASSPTENQLPLWYRRPM